MIDAVRLTFTALGQVPTPSAGDLRVHGLEGATDRIRLGLDQDGCQHLLVESPSLPDAKDTTASISTRHRDLVINGRACRYLDVTCQNSDLVEVFDYFVAAVAEHSSSSAANLGVVVMTVLDRWRSFFASSATPPGRETVTAVLGELLLLRDIALITNLDVLATWVGPRGSRHDFRRGVTAVEVKTSRAHTSRVVSIHGEDQLQVPEGVSLHLHFVRLEEVAGLGVSITGLIDELATLGVPHAELLEALADAGIPAAALGAIGTISFDVRERATFLVDDAMPRITPASFVGGSAPAGVTDISYRLDLDHVANRALDSAAFEHMLRDLTPSQPLGR